MTDSRKQDEELSPSQRLRVVGPAFGAFVLFVFVFNGELARHPSVTSAMSAVFLLGPFAGPFVGLFGPVIGFEADSLEYCLLTGLPLLAMIASHPINPRPWTGVLCVVGVLFWFLLAMSYIHQASA